MASDTGRDLAAALDGIAAFMAAYDSLRVDSDPQALHDGDGLASARVDGRMVYLRASDLRTVAAATARVRAALGAEDDGWQTDPDTGCRRWRSGEWSIDAYVSFGKGSGDVYLSGPRDEPMLTSDDDTITVEHEDVRGCTDRVRIQRAALRAFLDECDRADARRLDLPAPPRREETR